MKHIFTVLFITLVFTGCNISGVIYNSKQDNTLDDVQEVVYEKCNTFFGPFDIGDSFDVDDVVKETIEDANEKGYYGNELVNVKVTETGGTGIVFSKYCLKVEGNLVYSE